MIKAAQNIISHYSTVHAHYSSVAHSQFHNHVQLLKAKILACHWTIKLGRQNGRLLHWPKCSYVKYKKRTLEAFVVASHLYAKFDYAVAHYNFSLLATALPTVKT